MTRSLALRRRGGGGGGGAGGDPTDVHSFEVNFGDRWGDAEVEFRGAGFCGASQQASGTFRRTGVVPYVVYAGGTMISGWSPALCGGDGRVDVQLWETDPFDQDDYFGSAQWYQNENGAMKYFIFWNPNGWARVVWTTP